MKFTELQLKGFSAPLSNSEEERCKNALKMIRDALQLIGYDASSKGIYELEERTHAYAQNMYTPSGGEIVLFVQGSYANNTNIRTQSDVDIAVILESTFIPKYRPNISGANYNFSDGTHTISTLKDDVEKALNKKFNFQGVERGDKSIKVHGNSYRVDADVVPAYRFRDYSEDYRFDQDNFVGGIEIRPDSGGRVINYPEQHIKVGKQKNVSTNHSYKKQVRIMKNIKKVLKEDGFNIPEGVSSFGLESLLWNIPDNIYTKYNVLRYTFDEILKYLKSDLINISDYKEANGIKPLITNDGQKQGYREFILKLSDWFEYDIIEG